MVVRSTQNDNLHAMALSQFMHHFFRKEPNGELSDVLIELPKSQVQVRDAKDTEPPRVWCRFVFRQRHRAVCFLDGIAVLLR